MDKLMKAEIQIALDEMLFKVCPEAFEEGWARLVIELNNLAYELTEVL